MADTPHLLLGVKAKLERANEILANLELEASRYFSQNPAVVRLEHKHVHDEYTFMAYGDPNPPLRFAVMTGEIVHHLRSSLDHLITALVINNGVQPTFQHQFPICTSEQDFDKACRKGQLRGLSESAKKLVRGEQPFVTPKPSTTILNVISKFDNADKHRLLVVVTAIAHLQSELTIGVDEAIANSPERKGKLPTIIGVEMGAKRVTPEGVAIFKFKLEEPAPELKIDDNGLLPQLAFETCGGVEDTPIIPILRAMIESTVNTVRLFVSEFDKGHQK